jgi:hypothetical protein
MRDRLRRVFTLADLFRPSRQSYINYDSAVENYDSNYDSPVSVRRWRDRKSPQSYINYDSTALNYDSTVPNYDCRTERYDSFAEAGAVATLGQVAS